MPDLQTEVSKIINSWNLPAEEVKTTAELSSEKKGLSERVYEFIKSTPKCTLEDIRVKFGVPHDDVGGIATSLKSLYDRQLIGRSQEPNKNYRGFGRRMVFVYWAVSDTYTTKIKGLYSNKNRNVKIEAKKKPVVKAAFKGVSKPAAPPTQGTFDAQAFVNSLNIYDARHVWGLLDIVFGKQGK